jgi:AhpD family alkylhydroperoxidase
MFRTLMIRMIKGMEKMTGVEAPYAYHLLDVAPARLWRFSLIKTVEGRRHVTPPGVYHAAGLASAMVEDCGPCVQIHVNFALKDGVAPDVLRALVARRFESVPREIVTAFKFGEAVSAGNIADEWRDEIRQRWGDKGVAELAFTVAVARFYPAVKRGLGYASACERVVVGNDITRAVKAAA